MEVASPAEQSASGERRFNIRKLSGAQEEVRASPECTLDELKDKLRTLGLVPPQRAFSLLTDNGQLLKGGSATLASLELPAGSSFTVLLGRARDYGSMKSFDRVLTGCNYPKGVLTNERGELFVTYFYGEVKVFNANFEAILETKMTQGPPTTMTFGPNGEFVIATQKQIQVCTISPEEGLNLLRTMGEGYYRGVAVCGDRVLAAEARKNAIHVFDFNTGELRHEWKGYNHPCGLALIDDELLAIADRRNDQIVISDLDGNRVRTIRSERGDARLVQPNDVAVDSDGNLLVMDTGNERIAIFDQQGSFLGGIMPGFFKNRGNTYCYLSVNSVCGAVAVSNDDEHKVVILQPPSQAS